MTEQKRIKRMKKRVKNFHSDICILANHLIRKIHTYMYKQGPGHIYNVCNKKAKNKQN